MRPAPVALAVVLAAVPGQHGLVDPVPLLLRSSDVPGATVRVPARSFADPRLFPCGPATGRPLRDARAASVVLRLREAGLSEAVYVFRSAAAARRAFRGYAALAVTCRELRANVAGRAGTVPATVEPYAARRTYGDESVASQQYAVIPGFGPQADVVVAARTGRVVLTLSMRRGVVPVDEVSRKAVERASARR